MSKEVQASPETYSEKMDRLGKALIVRARDVRLKQLEGVAETRLQAALYVAFNTGVADAVANISEQVFYRSTPVAGGITIEDDAIINEIFENPKDNWSKLKAAYAAGLSAGLMRVSGNLVAKGLVK